jgi:BirA family transcriptional regulator, biotin operon repressor / biotin---[acetyl-CoA-carboxylase] ligase
VAFALGPRAQAAGTTLAAFDVCGSTNTEAMERARTGERGPMWFVTTEQIAGKGRRSRPWIAPRGNLASSILEVMDIAPSQAATLGFAAGLALEAALQRVSLEARMRAPDMVPEFRLKWPNDVLAGKAKLSGILLEAEAVPSGLAVVVGIGTNVVAHPDNTPYPATSLRNLGLDVDAEGLFTALSDAWAEYRGIWDGGRGFGAIRTAWLDRAAGLGEPVSVQAGNSTLSGIFDTIDDAGCLIVATADGRRVPISAGDVHFGSAASARTTSE